MILLAIVFASGCGDDAAVIVDVQTDWIPGPELSILRVVLASPGGEPIQERSISVSGTEADRQRFAEGRRVAELGGLSPGEYAVTVEALRPGGSILATRTVRFSLGSTDVGVRVILARSCERVACPPTGAPELTECVGGVCADPRCQPTALEFCPTPACDADSECETTTCGGGVCDSERQCLSPGALAGCDEQEYCDPVAGCLPLTTADAGLPDAGTPDTGVDGGVSGTEVVAMDVGDLGTCVVLADGAVWCWGQNRSGQYGNGSTRDQLSPLAMAGVDDAVDVTLGHELSFDTGDAHVCVLRRAGVVSCAGYNHRGQLGDGTTSTRTMPVAAFEGDLTDVVQVEAGGGHTCARHGDGSVTCWGSNNLGQLGDGTTDEHDGARVATLVSDARDIAAGNTHTCVLTATEILCFGENGGAQHGIGHNRRQPGPDAVMDIDGSMAVDIDASRHTNCAVLSDGTAKCWGQDNGLLTHSGTVEVFWETARSLPGTSDATGIVMGHTSGCFVRPMGADCFGKNDNAQALPDQPDGRFPPTALDLGGPIRLPGPGRFHACAWLEDGRVLCWGRNYWGMLGDGSATSSVIPPAPVALP